MTRQRLTPMSSPVQAPSEKTPLLLSSAHDLLLSPSLPPASLASSSSSSSSPSTFPSSSSSSSGYDLVPITSMPAWATLNPFILTGYRPLHLPLGTILRSALPPPFHHAHNQSCNILTHLLPCLVLALVPVPLFDARFPDAPAADRLVFLGYVAAAMACLGVSAAYHTLGWRGTERWWDGCVRLDYAGITALIVGSFVASAYVLFYCEGETRARNLHWAVISVLGSVNVALLVHPRTSGEDFYPTRVVLFVCLGFSALIPVLHGAALFHYDQLVSQAGLKYFFFEGLCFVAGTVILMTRFPECRWPGKFDLCGASHSIFHCFIVAGIVLHIKGLMSAFEWNYANQRCLVTF